MPELLLLPRSPDRLPFRGPNLSSLPCIAFTMLFCSALHFDHVACSGLQNKEDKSDHVLVLSLGSKRLVSMSLFALCPSASVWWGHDWDSLLVPRGGWAMHRAELPKHVGLPNCPDSAESSWPPCQPLQTHGKWWMVTAKFPNFGMAYEATIDNWYNSILSDHSYSYLLFLGIKKEKVAIFLVAWFSWDHTNNGNIYDVTF